jgi:uncharacterized protein YndB with AHSA1/START domain
MTVVKWLGAGILVLVLLIGVVWVIGLALPKDHVASRTVTVQRPIGEVWAAVTDVESFPAWRPAVSRVEVLQQQPRRWREVGKDGTLTFEVVESTAPNRLVTQIVDKDLPFAGRWTYELRTTPTGTQLVITEHGEVYNPLYRFVSRFVMGHTATMDAYLEGLRQKLEQTGSGGA